MRRTTLALCLIFSAAVAADAQSDAGPWLVFTSGRSGKTDLYAASVTTGELRRLTATPERESQPAWSWDGAAIAFVRGKDIWTIRSDGGDPHNRTPGTPSTEGSPFWLPDGRLGFTSNRGGPEEIYVLNEPEWTPLGMRGRRGAVAVNGAALCYTRDLEVYWAPMRAPARERNVTRWSGSDHDCIWDPTGSLYLLVHSHRPYDGDRSGRLWLTHRNGTFADAPLTEGADNTEGDNSPAWHASGWIAWSRHLNCDPDESCGRQPDKTELFVRDPEGRVIRLTENAVEDSEPHFRP